MRIDTVLIFAGLLAVAGSAHAIGVDELVAKNAAARGGLDRVEAIKTLKLEGKQRFSGGFGSFNQDLVQYQKAPNSIRTESTVQGLTQIQAWDGNEAWQISPFQGRRDPERQAPDDAKGLADQASISGLLVDYRAKGSQIAYLGSEDVDGTNAYKLKVTLKNGDVQYVYLDPDHYLEIRTVAQREVRGTPTEDITDYGDYEQVAGVYFPFSMTTHSTDGGGEQQVTIEHGQANVALDDALFAFPSTPKSAK